MLAGDTAFSLGVAVVLCVTNVDALCGVSMEVCVGVVVGFLVDVVVL